MRTPEEIRKAVLAADYPYLYERHDDEMVRLAVREAAEECARLLDDVLCEGAGTYGDRIRDHFKKAGYL